MLTQAAMEIYISTPERGLEAMTAPENKLPYRVILSQFEQLGNTFKNFDRHQEAYPTRRQGLYATRSVRQAAAAACRRQRNTRAGQNTACVHIASCCGGVLKTD